MKPVILFLFVVGSLFILGCSVEKVHPDTTIQGQLEYLVPTHSKQWDQISYSEMNSDISTLKHFYGNTQMNFFKFDSGNTNLWIMECPENNPCYDKMKENLAEMDAYYSDEIVQLNGKDITKINRINKDPLYLWRAGYYTFQVESENPVSAQDLVMNIISTYS
ncbi:hypothetical protein JW968_04695 [Candidatus Woesearchaeota archaeon]|nr:hypothetical protein [Candidatus Woesearchaeota archaeon]